MANILKQLAVGRRPFDDPFFAEGDLACGFFKRQCLYDVDEEELCHQISKEFCCEIPGCMSRFSSVIEFEMHYNTLHRYVCCVCHKVLPTPHFLDLHIEESHDTYFSLQAERKPMYQCLVEDCSSRFQSARERKDHCIKVHSFPSDFRWLMPAGNSQHKKTKSQPKQRKGGKNNQMEVEGNSNVEPPKTDVEGDTAEAMEVNQTTSRGKQKTNQKKKLNKKEAAMDCENENSCHSVNIQGDQASSAKNSVPAQKVKSAVTFKGFVPRNISANRGFMKRPSCGGKEWHNSAPSDSTPSTLEGNSLSADLRDSLPTDMEAS